MFTKNHASKLENNIQTLDKRADKLRDQLGSIQKKLADKRASQQHMLVEGDIDEHLIEENAATIGALENRQRATEDALAEIERRRDSEAAELAKLREAAERERIATKLEAVAADLNVAHAAYAQTTENLIDLISSTRLPQAENLTVMMMSSSAYEANAIAGMQRDLDFLRRGILDGSQPLPA